MSTGDYDEASNDRAAFIDDAMDDDAGVSADGESAAAVIAASEPTMNGPISHAKKGWRRRPPTWAIAAAAAAVVGLVVGLLIGSGDPPAPVAAAPSTTRAAATTAPPPPVVTSLGHVAPLQVIIPTINVAAPLVNLGLNADGTLEVPKNFDNAGWFTGSNYPADPSGPPGIIAGHVDDYTGPAVFAELKNLVPGDEVQVLRTDNTVAVFVVTALAQYPKSAFPAAEVYAPVPDSELVLITCTGDFNQNTRSYLDNLVVRARLDMARSLEESNRRVAEGMTPPAVNQENV